MQKMSNTTRKILAYVILLLGSLWQLHYGPSKTALLILAGFDVVVSVLLFFAASIEPERDGLRVEQFGAKHLSYGDIQKSVLVPFFPQTFVLVITNQRFPLNILFCPRTLDIDSGGKVEKVKLTDFLRTRA
jgi:hypothetical protein